MSAQPPRVTPAAVSAELATATGGWIAPTPTQAWSLVLGALGYWLPHGLNQGIASARSARGKR